MSAVINANSELVKLAKLVINSITSLHLLSMFLLYHIARWLVNRKYFTKLDKFLQRQSELGCLFSCAQKDGAGDNLQNAGATPAERITYSQGAKK